MNADVAEVDVSAQIKQIVPGHRFDDGRYAGMARNYDGGPAHDLVLLKAKSPEISMTWQAAMDWAKSIGADLPTRKEQALLFANLGDEFQNDAYWSNEPYAGNADYAWYQNFAYGDQWHSHKSHELLAVAVRRIPIQ